MRCVLADCLTGIVVLFFSSALFAQHGPTALMMTQMGLVNVQSMDSTIAVSLMYSRADNFTGEILYTDLREAYLYPSAARALVEAQNLLKQIRPELSLKVYDAARPMGVQQKMWDVVADTQKQVYVSNPKNGGGLHNYGLAVDVTLCDEQGDTLDMGTVIDYMGMSAHTDKEEDLVSRGLISQEAYRNRQLLRKVMKEAGFKSLRTEWWHFNFVSRSEAKSNYKKIP